MVRRRGRRVRVLVLAASLAMPLTGVAALLTAPAAGAAITVYTDAGIGIPGAITTGPDGALWFTDTRSIGRITTAGAVSHFPYPANVQAVDIASGPDGALWFTDVDGNSINRLTTSGKFTRYTNAGIVHPVRITAGPDGALWFTNTGPDGNGHSIGRITTAGAVTIYTNANIIGPGDITAGPDGAVWFTSIENSAIGRITKAGTITMFTDPGIYLPGNITTGPDGALWFTRYNAIGRITTAGKVTVPYTFSKITPQLNGLATGSDGALWFTNLADGEIGRLTTTGALSYFAGPSVTYPNEITAGPDGALWFTNSGSIGRITVSTPPTTVPGAPVIGTATAGNGFAEVTITPPADDGGSAIMRYTTTCASSSGATGSTASAPGTVVVDGLTNGSTYTCTVTATNIIGTSVASAASNSFVPAGPATAPRAPTIDLATPGNGSVTVKFTPGSTGAGPTTFFVSCPPFVDVSWRPASPSGFASGTSSPITLSGLKDEDLYTCSAYARNAQGTSPLSQPSKKFVPSDIAHAPTAPRSPVAEPGNGQAAVRWTAPVDDGNSGIIPYIVTPYLGQTALTPQSFYNPPRVNMAATVTGLTNGKSYRFKVEAENRYGTSPPSVFSNAVTVGAPSAPTAVRATSAGGALKVAFIAHANNGAPVTMYSATCKSSNGGVAKTKSGKTGPIMLTGLTTGKIYTCTVTATNSRGTGLPSSASGAVRA